MRSSVLAAILAIVPACDLVWGLDGPADAVSGNGLVARYSMDELTGDRLIDTSGYGHDGVCVATCPEPTTGRIGGALLFRGVEVIRIESTTALELSSAFTLGLWFQTHALLPISCALGKPFGLGDDNTWDLCFVEGQPFINIHLKALYYEVKLDDGAWHHLAARYDGEIVDLAIDGAIRGSMAMPPAPVDDSPVLIGSDLDSMVPEMQFVGSIDNVVIYNRALSDSDLAELADVEE